MHKQLLIIGCGYLGRCVARRFMSQHWQVTALTRTAARAQEFAACGIKPIVGDIMQPASLAALPPADVVLYAVGFDRQAGFSMREVYVTGLKHTLEALDQQSQRLIYISSTSVYGQDQGDWIDEQSPTIPARENGQICLEAEGLLHEQFSAATAGRSHTILRLAGIYGPGRTLSRIEQLKQQIPLTGTPAAWLNLIHVHDAAEVVYQAATKQMIRPLYLVSDDEPVTRGDYYAYLAKLAQAPEPLFDPDAPGGKRATGLNKRCKNVVAKTDLTWQPTFANYRLGLEHSWNLAPEN